MSGARRFVDSFEAIGPADSSKNRCQSYVHIIKERSRRNSANIFALDEEDMTGCVMDFLMGGVRGDGDAWQVPRRSTFNIRDKQLQDLTMKEETEKPEEMRLTMPHNDPDNALGNSQSLRTPTDGRKGIDGNGRKQNKETNLT